MTPTVSPEQPISPRESASWLSIISFSWVWKLMLKGRKRPLQMEEIYRVLPEDKSETIGKKVIEVWLCHLRECAAINKEPSLIRVLYQIFGMKLIAYSVVCFLNETIILLGQPICLAVLLESLDPDIDSEWTQYIAAAGIISTSIWKALTTQILQFGFHHVFTHIRIACSVLIYHKCMRIGQSSPSSSFISEALSLISTDVNRLDELEIFCVYIILAPIQLALALSVLYYYLKYPALIGLILFFCYIPFEFYMGGCFSRARVSLNSKKDKRLHILTEIFSSIKEIKMYGWEKFFMQKADKCRKEELHYVKRTFWLRAINSVLSLSTTKLISFLTLLMYVLINGSNKSYLTPHLVFVTLNIYENLHYVVTIFFARGVEDLAEVRIVLSRIKKFLVQKEVKYQKKYSVHTEDIESKDVLIEFNDCNFKPVAAAVTNNLPLTNINLQLMGKGLTMLIGPGGCGKSTILQAIMGEIPCVSGTVTTRGNIVYLSGSEPWVFRGTVEENILFGLPMRHLWYEQVTDACAIPEVIDGLPNKGKTKIDSGVISKGHMCRISLARAVYSNAHIYLLDDCMVHIDTHAARRIMDKCIAGILREKLIILTTTQLQFLEYSDRIILLFRGKIRLDGSYSDFKSHQSQFMSQQSVDNLDTAESMETVVMTIAEYEEPTLESRSDDDESDSNQMVVVCHQPVVSPLAIVSEEYLLHLTHSNEEMATSKPIGIIIYHRYMRIGSNIFMLFIFALWGISTQISHSGGEYWLEIFTKTEEQRKHGNENVADNHLTGWLKYLGSVNREIQTLVFAALTIALVVFSVIRTIMFYGICLMASTNAYNKLMYSLLRAPQKFFDINTKVRILNRLSQDINSIDDHLPPSLYELLDTFSLIVGTLVVVSALNVYFLLPSIVLLMINILLQFFHQKTLASLKRLEGISRSPIMTTLTTTLRGIATIRSFEQEKMFFGVFYSALDNHTGAWYLFLAYQRALSFVIAWCSVAYISIITITFFFVHNESDPAAVGLGIHAALTLAELFQWQLRIQSEVDAMMVSVDRILEYSSIEPEAVWESESHWKPPEEWPNMGEIFIEDLTIHSSDNVLVLDKVSCHILPHQKIGIVGRTGCGKSLFLSTLLRIVEPTSGTITIDGVDILQIGLHDLRQNIAVVPAEPIIFLGTVRENYDPFEKHDDDDIWQVLSETYLFDTVKSLPFGLDTEISDEGLVFTLAQKQLLCLGRALLHGSQVVLCDINPESDELVQEILMSNFRNCTIIASAHQLHCAIEFDKLIVLQDGIIDDFDEPYKLLQKKHGAFFRLTEHSGSTTIKTLNTLAKEAKAKKGISRRSLVGAGSQRRSVRLFSSWNRQNSY